MINVLIIEDELIAFKRMKRMIEENHPTLNIIGHASSVVESIDLLKVQALDLIFMDIQLSDGECFEIFEKIEVTTPIIFTTAYSDYALKAFKVNSIDYLMKPIDPGELNYSISHFNNNEASLKKLLANIHQEEYKSRFLVRSGLSMVSICAKDIRYFLSKNKLTYLITTAGKKFVTDHSLEEVEKLIDPKTYKRINRNMIVSHESVVRLDSYFNNRIMLELSPKSDDDVVVSRFYLKEFRSWMGE